MSHPHPSTGLMTQLLDIPQFTTDLFMPRYRDDHQGRWKMNIGATVMDRGYWGQHYISSGMPALLRHDENGEWETWMSLSPFELESQELAVRHAHGHMVIMGLGMGWIAVNAALNRATHRVTVIERDPEVRALFERGGVLEQLPSEASEKITLTAADALEWIPDEPVDLLYPDIWLRIAEPATLPDTRRMQANVQAKQLYFWGQELILERIARAANNGEEADEAGLRRAFEELGLPLLWPGDDYPAHALTAARVFRERFPHAE